MRRYILRALLALGLVLAAAGRAEAHPLGNFTINQLSVVTVSGGGVKVHYVVDMAEIPAFQEIQSIDADGSGQASEAERQAYLDRRAAELAAGLRLSVGGAPVALRETARDLSFPPGQGGLSTLRLTLDLAGDTPASSGPAALRYEADNFGGRLGWREIVFRAEGGLALSGSTALAADPTDELRSYPQDSLSSPLDMRAAEATLAPAAAGDAAAPPPVSAAPAGGRANDQLAALIASRDLSPGAILVALLLAFVLGAGHALTPGHGKTVVAAYMVGARGTPAHAIFLGLTTTVTHTAGVFLLGFVTLAVSRYILPEQLYPWLELASGLMVVAIGVALFRTRLVALLRRRQELRSHTHEHGPHTHTHTHDDHEHEHGPHTHTHDDHAHEHGPHTHTHDPEELVARVRQGGVSWRSLVALGVSGGLIPCPSALVVLLGAVALGRVGFGLLLIVAFSAGLATVLTGLGLLLVYARGLFERMPTSGLVMRALPVASAALVTLAGCAIALGALAQAGVVHL